MRKTGSILLFAACTLFISANGHAQDFFQHTVTKGQGLYSISRSYGVTENDIIKYNPGSETVIKEGQILRIPQKKTSSDGHFHTVMQGETLYGLARDNRVSIKEICDANPGLSVENLKAGMVLAIPSATDSAPEPGSTDASGQASAHVDSPDFQIQLGQTFDIERKTTIYRICKDFNISQEEFYKANPQYRSKRLAIGDRVIIPFSEKQIMEQQATVRKRQDSIESVRLHQEELAGSLIEKKGNHVTAALLLPFALDDSIAPERPKMLDFYRGLLLATEKLKQEGFSIDLKVFDAGREGTSVSGLLESGNLADADIVFGPKWTDQIAQAAAWSTANAKTLVLPFNANADEVFNNPHVFQLNTPQSYFNQEIYDHFLETFPADDTRLIILDAQEYNRNQFLEGLEMAARDNGIPFITVPVDTAPQILIDTLDSLRRNVFIINSPSSGPLLTMLPVLQLVERAKDPEIRTCLFGYPEYQIYAADHLDELFECDTWFYSWFYTNNLLAESVDFGARFIRSFNRQMMVSYPSYAPYGYDTGYYFLKGVAQYGSGFESNLDNIQTDPVQMGFKFERVNNWGGLINRKVFFIHFRPDYQVEKIDFDK